MRYDTLTVGGGAAGGLLALRATQEPERSVPLLEAGPDFGPTAEGQPPDVIDADDPGPTGYDRGLEAELGALGRRSPVFAGRLVGGSSATDNVMALRGRPADYDAWASAGNHGWSYAEVPDPCPCAVPPNWRRSSGRSWRRTTTRRTPSAPGRFR